MSDPAAGTAADLVLGGRYRLGEPIGQGATGTVHRAHDESLGRNVAVKILARPTARAREVRADDEEVRLLTHLNHHNLVTLLDAGTDLSDPDRPQVYLVMELIDGPDLKSRLVDGAMTPRDVAQIGVDLVEGLDYVHDHGVIHRDVKPANIMVSRWPVLTTSSTIG